MTATTDRARRAAIRRAQEKHSRDHTDALTTVLRGGAR